MKGTGTISRSVELGLHFIGVWPDTPYPRLHKFFWVTSIMIIQIFQYRYLIVHSNTANLSHLIDAMSTTLPYSLLSSKLIVIWINHRVLRDILSEMIKDCRTYPSADLNNLISKKAYLSARLSNIVIGLYSLAQIAYAGGVLLTQETISENDEPSRGFVLKMEFPFEINTSPVYELVLVGQFIHQFLSATSVGIINASFLIMTLHAGCQVDMVCLRFSQISSMDKKELNLLIARHQKIIVFVGNIEKLFTHIALTQFVSNTLIICCLGFLIVISLGMDDGFATFARTLLFYIAINAEAFIFCFAGEYISVKSRQIGQAAYESLWYDFRPNEIRSLLILILRSQKELTISVGKFMNLSLERFTAITKASASYVSVLLAMY